MQQLPIIPQYFSLNSEGNLIYFTDLKLEDKMLHEPDANDSNLKTYYKTCPWPIYTGNAPFLRYVHGRLATIPNPANEKPVVKMGRPYDGVQPTRNNMISDGNYKKIGIALTDVNGAEAEIDESRLSTTRISNTLSRVIYTATDATDILMGGGGNNGINDETELPDTSFYRSIMPAEIFKANNIVTDQNTMVTSGLKIQAVRDDTTQPIVTNAQNLKIVLNYKWLSPSANISVEILTPNQIVTLEDGRIVTLPVFDFAVANIDRFLNSYGPFENNSSIFINKNGTEMYIGQMEAHVMVTNTTDFEISGVAKDNPNKKYFVGKNHIIEMENNNITQYYIYDNRGDAKFYTPSSQIFVNNAMDVLTVTAIKDEPEVVFLIDLLPDKNELYKDGNDYLFGIRFINGNETQFVDKVFKFNRFVVTEEESFGNFDTTKINTSIILYIPIRAEDQTPYAELFKNGQTYDASLRKTQSRLYRLFDSRYKFGKQQDNIREMPKPKVEIKNDGREAGVGGAAADGSNQWPLTPKAEKRHLFGNVTSTEYPLKMISLQTPDLTANRIFDNNVVLTFVEERDDLIFSSENIKNSYIERYLSDLDDSVIMYHTHFYSEYDADRLICKQFNVNIDSVSWPIYPINMFYKDEVFTVLFTRYCPSIRDKVLSIREALPNLEDLKNVVNNQEVLDYKDQLILILSLVYDVDRQNWENYRHPDNLIEIFNCYTSAYNFTELLMVLRNARRR